MMLMACLSLLSATPPARATDLTARPLVELLGYAATDRLLIINGDDLGMSHATNQAIFDAMEHGVLTSATLMTPTAWVKEVALWAAQHPEADIGVHLTHTAEWKLYRWGPVAGRGAVPGLVGPDGYLWPECEDVWAHATPAEAETEAHAQIEMARQLGIDITHLDSHMGAIQTNPAFWQVYLKLAGDYQLPQRQASAETYESYGFAGLKTIEKQAGVAGPDVLMVGLPSPATLADVPELYNDVLRNLKPGVTELYLHPALDGPEMQAICGSHARREADYRWLVDPRTRQLISNLGIKLIGYRPLRDLMRGTTP
jgi:chitin disaccharide deacetylase